MNKQPFYHDIQVYFENIDDGQLDGLDDFIFNMINDPLLDHVKEQLASDKNVELLEDTLEVVGGSDGLQILFATTNGHEPNTLYKEIHKFVHDKINKHGLGYIRVEILNGEPEAGDPNDLM